LPTLIEETPEELICKSCALEFLAASEKRAGIDDLGWLGAHHYSLSTFGGDVLTALKAMPTVKARLDRFAGLSALEDSKIDVGITESQGIAEVYCDNVIPKGSNGYHIAEWTQVYALIVIVRSIVGETWSPDEIRFKSDFKVCDEARQANPNTRFRKRSAHTSIIMPSSVLAASRLPCAAVHVPDPNIPETLGGMENLKRLIRPYLRAVAPQIDVLAEITGTSKRTLQRQLQNQGVNFRQLIEITRFEMAGEMLREPDTALINVAMTLGYENQSNFGRSFRRVAGISPGKFRSEMIGQERAA